MKYSEFLSHIISQAEGMENFYLCIEAKRLLDAHCNVLTKEQRQEAKPHLKRFLRHIKILLELQYKQLCIQRGYKPDFYPTVLSHYFDFDIEKKRNWLIAQRDKQLKLEAKANKA